MTQADGNPLQILGKTYIVLTFGNESRRHEVFVANIQSPAILGLDFIQSHQCKIDFSSNMFGLGHSSIPIHSETDSQVPRSSRLVTVASDTVLPAGHRYMVSLIINGDNLDMDDGIIEPLSRQSDLSFLLGNTLVKTTNREVNIEMMNFSADKVVLVANTIVGLLHPVDDICDKGDNSYGVQHVMMSKLRPYLRNCMSFGRRKESSTNLDCTQGQQLQELLGKHVNVFSLSDEDMGRTDVL